MITFTTFGTPVPQGSMRAFMPKGARFPTVTSDNKATRPWRHDIVAAAHDALKGRAPLEGVAVEVAVVFFMPRPQSAPKRVTEPAKKPDLDKLVRALLDALTAAGVWRDDGQVVSVHARKAFAGGPHDNLREAGIPRMVVAIEAVSGVMEGPKQGRLIPAADERSPLEVAQP